MPFLDSLSPPARAIGAVNTVIKVRASRGGVTVRPCLPDPVRAVQVEGRLHGENTDWIGMCNRLQAQLQRRAGAQQAAAARGAWGARDSSDGSDALGAPTAGETAAPPAAAAGTQLGATVHGADTIATADKVRLRYAHACYSRAQRMHTRARFLLACRHA